MTIYDDPLITYDGAPTDAYFAQLPAMVATAVAAATIPVDVVKMNGADVIGTGQESDRWRGVGVPS